MIVSTIVSIVTTLAMVIFKVAIVSLYDDSPEILAYTYPAFVTFCIVFNFDWAQNCMCGLIKAVN